jgi:hypothetical protein
LNPELWQTPRQSWGPFRIWLPCPTMHRARHMRSWMMPRSCMMRKIVFTAPVEPSRFASSVVTPRGYKAGVFAPAPPTSSRMTSHRFSTSFPMAEKNEKIGKQIKKKQEGVVERTSSCFCFPSVPWRSQVGPRQRSCKSTYKIS